MRDKEIDDLMVKKIDKRREREKDASDLITHDATIDLKTRKTLFFLLNKGVITRFTGIISSGKEANVYAGIGKDGMEIAIKIYRINSQTSKWMMNYIMGDPRFSRFRKKSTRNLITTWALKELKNLKRAEEAGVPCPKPISVRENVLVMQFLGEDGTPAKKLTEVELDKPLQHLNEILKHVQSLFWKAGLIHGDLSPFNMLYHEGKVYFIDIGQGVLKDHPYARKYFERDVDNVLSYFTEILPGDFDRDAVSYTHLRAHET